MPAISVIIPAYNAEKTIGKTIQSVLDQTFSDFEIIVVNDGSQDRTLAILQSIEDPRLKIFSQENAGGQRSRNRGIELASGNYFAFLDSDDRWTPDKLKSQLQALQDYPEVGVAYSWTNYFDEHGNYLHRGSYISKTGNVFAQLLLANFIENGSNPLVRREAIETVGGFDESLVGGQDWDLWLRLAARYSFISVSKPQILYTKHSNSWSMNVERQELGLQQVMQKGFAIAPDPMQKIKKHTIANCYKLLVYDALRGELKNERAILAIKWLWVALKNDPTLLRKKVLVKVLLKIAAIIALPSQQAKAAIARFKTLSNLDSWLGTIRSELPDF